MRLIEDCLVNGMERTNGRLDEWMNGEKSQVLNIWINNKSILINEYEMYDGDE